MTALFIILFFVLFSVLLLTSRRARHERTLLAAGSFLTHVRSAAAGHAADGGFGHHYGTFVNAADDFRVDSVGDTDFHRMGGKGVAFAGQSLCSPSQSFTISLSPISGFRG